MITGELKNKIDGLWDIFAAGGLVNPLEVIEQITYLMFIHDLDDSDNMRARESAMLGLPFQSIFFGEVKIGERTIDGSQLKWSVFHDFPADRIKFQSIINRLEEKISARKKFLLIIVHESVGMKWDHDSSIIFFTVIFQCFKTRLFISPFNNSVTIRVELR